jgi:hypothetical protein
MSCILRAKVWDLVSPNFCSLSRLFSSSRDVGLPDKSLPSFTLIANAVTTTPLASDVAIRNSKGHERIIECGCLHNISKAMWTFPNHSMCFKFHVSCPYSFLKTLFFVADIVYPNTCSMLLASTCDFRKFMSYRYCISQHRFNTACQHVWFSKILCVCTDYVFCESWTKTRKCARFFWSCLCQVAPQYFLLIACFMYVINMTAVFIPLMLHQY